MYADDDLRLSLGPVQATGEYAYNELRNAYVVDYDESRQRFDGYRIILVYDIVDVRAQSTLKKKKKGY